MNKKLECPTTVKFGFNPHESSNPVFKDLIATILWACIKFQHLADQYFDVNILTTAEGIRQIKPKTYDEFKNIIAVSSLRHYGLDLMGAVYTRPMYTELSDTFWRGIWDRLTKDGITIKFGESITHLSPAISLQSKASSVEGEG